MSLFYAGLLNLYWLIAFKYWVVSQEMHKVLDRQLLNSNEKKYRILNASGIALNLVVGIWLGTVRGRLANEGAF